jgi:DnaJ-domain-containing protein 1
VTTYLAGLHGEWLVADFGGGSGAAHDAAKAALLADELQAYYDILGLPPDATLSEVKKAYRLLARRYHPDVNTTPEANDAMQRLNTAYARIIEQLSPFNCF